MQPNVVASTSSKRKPNPVSNDGNKTQTKLTNETFKKGFLRDRIAKRKEAETNEFGEEEEAEEGNKQVDELNELTKEEIGDFSLYRESYVLTITESQANDNDSKENDDSFDVTQMSSGQFESFAEVCILQ